MRELELLSPAGDLNIFKAVINRGADAVYFGGDLFGARAYAKNFSIEEGAEAIKYAHLHKAKAYLTVNTLLKNTEIEKQLYDYIKAYVENGIDAFIVQDVGVFDFIKEYFPDTALHASTQMSFCTSFGARLMQDMGASRIVTAREISISEIAAIHAACPELEIESFIHGALCVCYSGQCLMSSMLGGRSGNRGRCAQPCRLPYTMLDSKEKKVETKGPYLLSPKDFCTIESLPDMIEAGVNSFKIEGRMKKLNYAAGVVSIYRHYIDCYLNSGKEGYQVLKKDMAKLLDYGNRCGFTDLYLKEHNGPDMITFQAPSHTHSDDQQMEFTEEKLVVNCRIKALLGQPLSLTFYDREGREGCFEGQIVEGFKSKPTGKDEILKAISQLGDTAFVLEEATVEADDNIFLPVSAIKKARRAAIEDYQVQLLQNKAFRINKFASLNEKKNSATQPDLLVLVSDKAQLDEVLKHSFVKQIAVSCDLLEYALEICRDKEIFLKLPDILREKYANKIILDDRLSGVIACSMDQLGFLKDKNFPQEKIYLDHRLYTYSNRAIRAFVNLGYQNNCAPYELSLKELEHRDNENSTMIIYSHIPMMVTTNCQIKNTKGCNKAKESYYLLDRKKMIFPVKCNCDFCYNTLYNSKKYMAFDLKNQIINLGMKHLRIDFTIENKSEVSSVLKMYEETFINNRPGVMPADYTRGHLKRGVE